MAKPNIPGEHKKFDSIPKFPHKDIETSARAEANIELDVNVDNLPKVIYKAEQALQNFHHAQYIKAQEYFHQLQSNADINLAKSDVSLKESKVHSELHSTKNFNLDKEEIELRELHNEFELKKKNFLDFKKHHSLALLPVNSDGNLFQWLVLISLFIIESIVNYSMMMSGDSVTRNQAMSIGISQAAVNIISCYMIGRLLMGRIIHAENQFSRVSLSLFLLLHMFIIVLLNANMGIFRDAIVKAQSSETLGDSGILSHWEWSPWDKVSTLDVTAVLIISVGIVLAVVSYIDGYFADDPYPGYGAIYRSLIKIKSKVSQKTMALREAWLQSQMQIKEIISKTKKEGVQEIDLWSTAINDMEQVSEDYKKLLEHLDKEFTSLVNLYETTYNKFRNDKKINLKSAKLLNSDDYDLVKVFRDVKDYLIDDTTRLDKAGAYKKTFAKDFEVFEKELTKISADKFSRIEALGECRF
ncbi:hypothetical protein MCETRH20_01626 [Methylophilaceae bacterium]